MGRGTTEQDLGVGDVINSQFPPKAGYYPLLSHPEWTMVGRVDVQFPSFEGRFFWSDVMIIFLRSSHQDRPLCFQCDFFVEEVCRSMWLF